jgi:uncharacterized protein
MRKPRRSWISASSQNLDRMMMGRKTITPPLVKRWRTARRSVAVWLLLLAVPVWAQTFPALSGRVVDAANILAPDQEAALTAKLAALEQQTTRQLVIATIPDLEGNDIADYGYRLGDFWKIGQKGENNGMILLVAPQERRVRIEVGPGLEGIMPDVLASRIVRGAILPQFKAGNYAAGIDAGTDQIIALIKLPPGEVAQRARQAGKSKQNGPDLGAILFWIFIFLFFILPIIRGVFGGRRGRRFGSGPVIIWGGGSDWSGGGGGSWGSGGGFGDGGGFSGGGGSFGGGGASGGW